MSHCVRAKLLEHVIICKYIISHFIEKHFFFNYEKQTQTDVVVLISVRLLTLSPTNASYTNLTIMEFEEQL